MGFNKVYNSLQEIFPQIDARALRAVAIEHSKDADAAVGAVLEEIIPFFIERSKPSSPLTRSISVGESSEGAIVGTQTEDGPSVNAVGSAGLQNGYNVNSGSQQSFLDADDGPNEPFYDAYDGHHEGEDNTAGLTLSGKTFENRLKMSADVYSNGEPVVLVDLNAVDTLQIEVSRDPEAEETISGDEVPESSIKISSDSIPRHTLATLQDVDMGVNQIMNLIQEGEDIAGHLETDFDTIGTEENDLEKSCADGNNLVDETASLTVHDVTVRPLESSAQLVEVPDTLESNLEKLELSLSTDTASNTKTMSNIVGTEDESILDATMSQSSQIHIIDVVEEIIADARNNKKTLFLAMESVISLMRQVELREQAVEQAKEEAAIGGTGILDKVEELKRMLQHAKDANDMHAGEVYGEKAILATELRELQSRVLSLSDERDKSLVVLDEMRQTLEVQLAAAENEIKSADEEKLEKEKAARKSLADQELIMEKVVQESKILKQQAEDNAKLQEFLVDRGRVVDMLQGEIAVICQDVRLLKEKFDEHVPFSKSLSSNQTSFILASSNSSLKSLIPDQVEPVPVGDDLLETQKKGDHEQVSEEEAARDDRKALLDDGWEFFDSSEIDA
ncbi:hypothetical protein Pfo_006271 [Paulownia fortunei]|nr:hypothetical protein Pfo_006271 [Paulownia fortunei]